MPSFSPVIETAAVAIAPAAIDIIGQIQKVEKRGPVPQFCKEGVGKQHLNENFSAFLINLS